MEKKLEKSLSPINVISLALGCIIGGSCFILPGTSFLGKAGPLGVSISMVFAALVMIIIAFNYSYMINLFPLAGGEFTYTKEVFGNLHSFVCSWFLSLSYIALVPLNATALGLVGRTLLNNVFQFGFHYTIAGYDIYLGEILLAYVALLVLAYFNIKGVKVSGIFQTILVFTLVLGVAVITIAALCKGYVTVDNLAPLYVEGKSEISCILSILVVAPYCFVGFDTIPQSAEEFKFSAKKTRKLLVIAIIWGAFVYIAVNIVTAAVIPSHYSSWSLYLQDLSNLDGITAMPTFNATYILLGEWGLFFLGLAVFSACLTGIIGFYMAASRLLYSMSKENVIPAWFGFLNNNSTPSNSILFIFVISILGPLFGRNVLGWIVDMSSVGAAIGYAYTSAATFCLARKEKKAMIMLSGMIGTIMGIIFLLLLVIPIPYFNCSLGKEAYVCLIIWIIIGVAFYCFTRKEGISNQDNKIG